MNQDSLRCLTMRMNSEDTDAYDQFVDILVGKEGVEETF